MDKIFNNVEGLVTQNKSENMKTIEQALRTLLTNTQLEFCNILSNSKNDVIKLKNIIKEESNPFLRSLAINSEIFAKKNWLFIHKKFSIKSINNLKKMVYIQLKMLNLYEVVDSLRKNKISVEYFTFKVRLLKIREKSVYEERFLREMLNHFEKGQQFKKYSLGSPVNISLFNTILDNYNKLASVNGKIDTFQRKKRSQRRKKLKPFDFGDYLRIKVAAIPQSIQKRKPLVNRTYRFSRIFRFMFGFKPFKMWQISRRGRAVKFGGLISDQTAYYDLTLNKILLKSNFVISQQEANEVIMRKKICINGQIVSNKSKVIRPFQTISIVSSLRDEFRNRLLSRLMLNEGTRVLRCFLRLFEYNFRIMAFTVLPLYFKYKRNLFNPIYSQIGQGKFQIERIR